LDFYLKLKISINSGKTVEEINLLVQQFKTMDIMHRVLKYRKTNGKSIPKDEKSLQSVLELDAKKVLTKKEKKMVLETNAKSLGKHR